MTNPHNKKLPENGNSNPAPMQMTTASAVYSGPLPPAEAFERYEKTLEGAADRILQMAESEAIHRRQIESSALYHNIWIAHLSQIFAFILGISGLIGGVYCIVVGQPWAGAAIGGATLVALVSAFLRKK